MNNLVYDFNEFDSSLIAELLGNNDTYLKMIADFYKEDLCFENGCIYSASEEHNKQIIKVLETLIDIYNQNQIIEMQDVIAALNENFTKKFIAAGVGNRKFYLRTIGQNTLYQAYSNNVMTFAVGPAGTGKTFLAVIYAYNLLKQGSIKKIIITRPVVESGESLGFLPGDLKEKIDPYLRPIYDSFESLIGNENMTRMIEKGIIEIAPLAYMRGRTLNDACVILDEAQNTTPNQIKMFLTRLGFNSKMIITGDITQIDLPSYKQSGLIQALKIVEGIEGIAIVNMSNKDVVRHPIVSKIIDAYERNE